MTREAFRKFCDDWRKKGAVDFTRKSHFEEMSDMIEPHGEVVEVRKDDFHNLGKGVYYPRKETSDKLGHAAGISFLGEVHIQKQDDGAWVGTAYPQELGPDGKMITWAPASYEFNPIDRAKLDLLREQVKYNKGAPSNTAVEIKTLEYKQVAARRADTGARVAAIISAIGMPTGFKELFGADDPPNAIRYFLFSRIIVNAKNEFVMSRALDSLFGAVKAIAGPQPTAPQITAPENEPPMRQAEDQKTTPVGNTAANLAGEALDDGFGDDYVEEKDSRREAAETELEQWIASGRLTEKMVEMAKAVLDSKDSTTEKIESYVAQCRRRCGAEATA